MDLDHFIALTEVKRGLLPALISPLIVDSLSRTAVSEMMLGAGRLSMDRLYQLGELSAICGHVAPLTRDENVESRFATQSELIQHYVGLICQNGPQAVSNCKAMIRTLRASDEEWKRRLDHVQMRFKAMMDSEEAQFGMMHFVQKKKVDWSKL